MSWKLTKSTWPFLPSLWPPATGLPSLALRFAPICTDYRQNLADNKSSTLPELKETHLGPLASTFSRSPSTSTITDKDDKSQSASGSVTPTAESSIRMFDRPGPHQPADPVAGPPSPT